MTATTSPERPLAAVVVEPDSAGAVRPAGTGRSGRGRITHLARYCGASAVSTTIGLTVLCALVWTGATSAGWANVVATAAGTGPSFELNRRWVWRRPGRRAWGGEVVPFCVLSFLSLGASTEAVRLATGWAAGAGWSPAGRAAMAAAANLAAFGTMWVVQFFVLDRLLFRAGPRRMVAG